MKFVKWFLRSTFRSLLELACIPFAIVVLIVVWPIMEVVEAYDDAKRRGEV